MPTVILNISKDIVTAKQNITAKHKQQNSPYDLRMKEECLQRNQKFTEYGLCDLMDT